MTTTQTVPAPPAPSGTLLANNPRWAREARWRSVAMEIARDIFELKTILDNHSVDDDEWEEMERSPGFQRMLEEETLTWRSSLNTRERIEARTLLMVEGSLEEMYRALHDSSFSHASKVELFKALSRNIGIGIKENTPVNASERVSITINMGDDRKVEVQTQDVTPRVIEGVEFAINE